MKLIIAYIVNPIIDKPVANPSNPSVKLTAFENPTCQKTIKITYANDNGIPKLVNGIFILVENSIKWKTSLRMKNIIAIAIWAKNFCLLVSPWLFFLTTIM